MDTYKSRLQVRKEELYCFYFPSHVHVIAWFRIDWSEYLEEFRYAVFSFNFKETAPFVEQK